MPFCQTNRSSNDFTGCLSTFYHFFFYTFTLLAFYLSQARQ
jgi:hypothetical protein